MRLFIDANIFIDVTDSSRQFSKESIALMDTLFDKLDTFQLFTSCDLITTIYYITRKNLNNNSALQQTKRISGVVSIVEFGNDEVNEAIALMESNPHYSDLEDTIQYIMARKAMCDYIVTNDSRFFSEKIPVLGSPEALATVANLHRDR